MSGSVRASSRDWIVVELCEYARIQGGHAHTKPETETSLNHYGSWCYNRILPTLKALPNYVVCLE